MACYERVLNSFEPLLNSSGPISRSLPRFDAGLVSELITSSRTVLSRQSPLIRVHGPTTIVGDIHGNIQDLLNILRKFNGFRRGENLVFLGDYVDRGLHSIEVIVLLLALMCKYPKNVFLLRGNHEFSQINRSYGFYEEVITTYCRDTLWMEFNELFCWFPLAAVVSASIFCVHGGLSPEMKSLAEIEEIEKPVIEYDDLSMIGDLVWSDPNPNVSLFAENHRGCGVLFGVNAIKNFFRKTNLKLIVRGHQCVCEGFSTFAQNTGVTVFSSSKYGGYRNNRCGVMYVANKSKIEFFTSDSSGNGFLEPRSTMYLRPDFGICALSDLSDVSPKERPCFLGLGTSPHTSVCPASPCSRISFRASPKARTDTNVCSPKASTKNSVSSPMASTDTNVCSPKASTKNSVRSPKGSTDSSIWSPKASAKNSVRSPKASARNSVCSPRASAKTSKCSPILCKERSSMFSRTAQSPVCFGHYKSVCRRDY